MTNPLRCLVLIAFVLAPSAVTAQILRVEQMNSARIAGLDRQKTAVVLWGGILEEHGPYLPTFTDGYMNEYLARKVAEAIAARPGWAVLLFPPVPLGLQKTRVRCTPEPGKRACSWRCATISSTRRTATRDP